ncbi:MAG: patatin-like phospholipase family protein [Desulfobacterales bacterium]|nr:patatin-like phospholipase family protein [Desulfobacterales bacterium]
MTASDTKRIDIALQGGGAHGAFTWGVLDRLLEERRIEIEGISGTSAGSMNAVALAQGLADRGPRMAQELLAGFWKKVSEAARLGPVQRSFFDVMMGRWSLDLSPSFIFFEHFTRTFSPYEFNPFDINPLRDIVAEVFDFDVINNARLPTLFLSATNVRTGRAKVFRQPEISVDATMASACLPFLFQAVEIDGEAYWDGGYMGNPPIFPLIDETEASDIVIVQINPFSRSEIPRTAYEINNRLNEITFNASLKKELRAAAFLSEIIHHENLDRQAYRDGRLHLIQSEEEMRKLSVSSKLNAEWQFLQHLHDIGWRTADQWLAAHFDDLGVRTSWFPEFVFEESLKPAHLPEDRQAVKDPKKRKPK